MGDEVGTAFVCWRTFSSDAARHGDSNFAPDTRMCRGFDFAHELSTISGRGRFEGGGGLLIQYEIQQACQRVYRVVGC